MERSAVSRLTDVFGVGVYGLILLWSVLQTGHDYYFAFFTTKPIWIGDLILMTILTLWFGWLFVVQVYKVRQGHSGRWFFRNLGVYLPLLFLRFGEWLSRIFWLGLVNLALWMVRHLLVLASRGMSQAYPGRGMVFSLDFEDERDFKSMVKTAREEGLPLTSSKDGRPMLYPEEYHATLDDDILDTSLTFPAFAALHVVDANPPEEV